MNAVDQTTIENIDKLALDFERKSPQQVLAWALEQYHPEIALASSFSLEDVAIIDMLFKLEPEAKVFYLDTGLLFPETHEVRRRIEEKYGIVPAAYKPLLTVAEQAANYGDHLYWRDPNLCCQIRKVEPLRRALSGLRAWTTGIRREQSPTRAHARPIEWDGKNNLVKVNPLVAWNTEQVWQYVLENDVPYNPLHLRGYPSIGCYPCTRPVEPGEGPRAGRWSGFDKKECGLHM